jgi:murein DD-endopeptidase MepM/ murein hydrolase activator NlpD
MNLSALGKPVLAAIMLAPLMAACAPASPYTLLTWDANETLPPHKQVARRDTTGTARTYVYQGDAVPTPTPRPAYHPPVREAAAAKPTARSDASLAFAWPASGPVISGFGTTTGGQRNDGINIATAMDAPIHAAASGTITYAGNELKDYGNLILIKHADGYVTAYAHADRFLVAKGDFVAKGQVIGYSGATGDVSSPQLHFEIRHDTTPVNPSNLLVASRDS